ncbi:MAG: hypothetical protein ACI84C_002053 [Flavobacteriales bacterium]
MLGKCFLFLHIMKKLSLYFWSVLLVAAVSTGCKKDPVPPIIFVFPSSLHIQAESEQPFEFEIEAEKGDASLRQIQILEKPVGGITSVVLDTLVSGSKTSFFWFRVFPSNEEELIVTFRVVDEEGLDSETLRRVFIETNSPMTESTGHTLNSVYSTSNSNAFNIDNLESYFLANSPDSTLVDIIELDDTDDGEPSLSITSWSGMKFVRNNSFNYPEATQSTAGSTYTSSSALQVISALEVDDILIAETDTVNHHYAVVKITGIDNQADSDNDRYTFNVKK